VLIPVGKMQHNATLQQARVQQLEALQPPFSVLLVRCITLQHTATCCNTSTNSCATAGGAATRHVWRVHLYCTYTTYCNTLQHFDEISCNSWRRCIKSCLPCSFILVKCNARQHTVAQSCSTLQRTATEIQAIYQYTALQRTATYCKREASTIFVQMHCTNTLSLTATHCKREPSNIPVQRTASLCNALQRTAKGIETLHSYDIFDRQSKIMGN